MENETSLSRSFACLDDKQECNTQCNSCKDVEDGIKKESQSPLLGEVSCRSSFKGEVSNEEYDAIMIYIKGMQERGWIWIVDCIQARGENVYVDYELVKHYR